MIDINHTNTEKKGYIDKTPGDLTDEEHSTIQANVESQHHHLKKNDHMPYISQHDRVARSDAINMGDMCPSSSTKSTAKTPKHIHKRFHSGEECFKCDLCAYSTGRQFDLKKHKRVHSGEKPFACSLCDYRTKTYGHLRTHKLMHTGEKPYNCDL